MEPASSSAGSKEKDRKKISSVPETVLKAALVRRAVEDIRRLMELRSQKPALGNLLQKGSVGDDLWQRFLRAEKEMEEEFKDVIAEVCWSINCLQKKKNPHLFVPFGRMANVFFPSVLGFSFLPGLGPNDLPVRQRDVPQLNVPRKGKLFAVYRKRRARMVGSQESQHPGGIHEGVGWRRRWVVDDDNNNKAGGKETSGLWRRRR